jgi:hypothetical protein
VATFKMRTIRAGVTMERVETWGQATILFLILIGIASRLPFQSSILHHWDSVNFALALEKFDVRLHQPHPPGTFVFYIFLGRLFNLFLHDANTSLVWVSIVATGLAAALVFLLGTTWFGRRAGLIISLVMVTSPLVWFHGEVALSYMLEFFWVLLIVLACFKARLGDRRALFASALLMGLAGGIRPNTPVFLFPLWSVAVLLGFRARKYSLRDLIVMLCLATIGVMLWAVPLVTMSGGPAAYWKTIQIWRAGHMQESGSAEDIISNIGRLVMYILYGVGVGLIPVGWALVRDWRALKDHLLRDWRAQTIALWVGPALAYVTFIHLRQPGHTFTIMPAFMIIAGLATALVARYLERFNQNAWLLVTGLVIVCNSLFFLFGPASLFGSSRLIFSTPTWTTIREYDTYVIERLDMIRREFSPEETAVIANTRNFRLLDFYLRDYQFTSLSYDSTAGPLPLPDQVHTLVIFDDSVLPQIAAGPNVRTFSLAGGDDIRAVTWNEDQQVRVSQTVFEIQDK